MSGEERDILMQLSDALARRAAAAAALVVGVRTAHAPPRSGILWRSDAVVASEQVFPKADAAEIVLAGGRVATAHVAGRDRGANVVALRLDEPVEASLAAPAEPRLGALALALGADRNGGAIVRITAVRSLGPMWHSLAGGRIDRRIWLDSRISGVEEGGPVVDAAGGLLGMSTAGPRGRALVIPASTVERVLGPLMTVGRVERGWLGVALYPVSIPEAVVSEAGQGRGLMVMQVKADSPAAKAGILAGDILVAVAGAPAARPGEIARRLGPESVGQAVELRLIRSLSLLTLTATVTARPGA